MGAPRGGLGEGHGRSGEDGMGSREQEVAELGAEFRMELGRRVGRQEWLISDSVFRVR